MSTASEGTSSDQPQRTSHQPGPLAILAATALGGVIATRIGKAPLLLAAGAAAMAMLRQKNHAPSPEEPQSQPPPVPPDQSQVEQWLSRQIIREEQAPVVDLSTAGITTTEPEEDYQPESFLLEDADETPQVQPDNEVFAVLTEPVTQPVLEPPPKIEERLAEPNPEEEMPASPPPALQPAPPPPPAVVEDSAWTLGVDPMPSFNEAEPYVAPVGTLFFSTPARQEVAGGELDPPRSHMFTTAPAQHEELGPPLFFATEVFQGAALPDEIQVAPIFDPAPPVAPPLQSTEIPVWEPEQAIETPLAVAASPEIPVELAAPGEASFDSPLAAAPPNPWQPEPEVFAMPPATPAPTQKTGTVVEAEIILRPRAPTQSAVVAKSKFAPPSFSKQFTDEDSAPPPAEDLSDAHFPGPLQSQHDPKPRPTWRSWWRGD